MNIYELEKQATPRPWEVAHDSTGYHTEHDGYPVLDGSEPQDEINAMLSSHCRNNFMRALEALKHLNDACRGNGAAMYDELIAELEEVK